MHIKIQKDVRNKFKSLQAEQTPGAMIEYLSSVLQTENADTFFTGFVIGTFRTALPCLETAMVFIKTTVNLQNF